MIYHTFVIYAISENNNDKIMSMAYLPDVKFFWQYALENIMSTVYNLII